MPKQPHPITIVSDGTPTGTFVRGPDGERLPGIITEISWKVAVGRPATATVTFDLVHLDVTAPKVRKRRHKIA